MGPRIWRVLEISRTTPMDMSEAKLRLPPTRFTYLTITDERLRHDSIIFIVIVIASESSAFTD